MKMADFREKTGEDQSNRLSSSLGDNMGIRAYASDTVGGAVSLTRDQEVFLKVAARQINDFICVGEI